MSGLSIVPARGRDRLLIAGDLVALVLFAVIGRRSHAEATGLEAVSAVLETAAPFVGGWVLAVLVLRASSADFGGAAELASRTARTWVVAFPIAVLLRAAILGRFSPWTFYVVTFLAALALVLIWRFAYVVVARRSGR